MSDDILISLFTYSLMAIVLFALGWHLKTREERTILSKGKALSICSWEIIVSIVFLALIVGFRYNTGSDYMLYLSEYFHLKHFGSFARSGEMEKGFEWITRAFVTLKIHFTVFFIFWAFVHAALLYYGLRRHKYLIPWFAILLVLGPYSYNWLSFMRQWVVTFAVLVVIPFMTERNARNFLCFLIIILACSLIHVSALALLPLYFFPYKKLSRLKSGYLIGIYVICVIVGLFPSWIVIFKPLFPLLTRFGYERYQEMLQQMLDGGFRWMAWGPLHFITFISQVVFIALYPAMKKHYSGDKILPYVFGLAFLGACYEAIMMNTVHFLVRPADLTYGCILFMLAYVCHYFYQTKRYVLLVVFAGLTLSYTYINIFKVLYNPEVYDNSCVLYHFFRFVSY